MSSRAEPEPNWNVARHNLSWLWPLHYTAFGSSALLLALASLWCIYRITRAKTKAPKRYFLTVSFLLLVFGLTRGVYLLLDPYGSHVNFNLPTEVEAILGGIAYPCLSSAFTLVFLSLLEVTKLQVFPRSVQRIRILAPLLVSHITVVLFSDIAGVIYPSAIATTLLCRGIFVLWGAFVFSSFLYAGVKVFKMFSSINSNLEDTSEHRRKLRRVRVTFGRQFSKVCKITSIASLLGLILCGMQIYSLHRVYRYLYVSRISRVDEIWEWWICESVYRLIEIAMGCLLCYIVHVPAKPSRNTSSQFRRSRELTAKYQKKH